MKKFSKIKLNQISKDELDHRQMNVLRGGGCVCGCECSCPCSCPCTGGMPSDWDSGVGLRNTTSTDYLSQRPGSGPSRESSFYSGYSYFG